MAVDLLGKAVDLLAVEVRAGLLQNRLLQRASSVAIGPKISLQIDIDKKCDYEGTDNRKWNAILLTEEFLRRSLASVILSWRSMLYREALR